jgi:hypothetical protein
LPLYPFLAILVAHYWNEYLELKKTTSARWVEQGIAIPTASFAGLLCLAGAALPIAACIYLPASLWLSVVFGLLFFISGLFLMRWFLHGHVCETFARTARQTVLLYVFVLLSVIPEMNYLSFA